MGNQHSIDDMNIELGEIYRLDIAINAIFLHDFIAFDSLEIIGRLAATRSLYQKLLIKHKDE